MGSDGPGRNVAGGPAKDGSEQLDLTRPDAYGQAFVDVYDLWYGSLTSMDGSEKVDRAERHRPDRDLDDMVTFVRDRCPSGLVIELGVGSGRLARPLVDAGLRVIGIDASRAMIERCPTSVMRVLADMATPPFRSVQASDDDSIGPTVLCGFNTLFNLRAANDLDSLLASIAALRGTFIVEMMNTDLLPEGPVHSTDVAPFAVDDGVVISATSIGPSRRHLAGRHLEITDRGVVSRPWLLRLVGLDELDTAAACHGLAMVDRYRSWAGDPFVGTDAHSISVFQRADT